MVTLADARRVIAAAEKKAAEIGQPMNIAVADGGGNIVCSCSHGQRLDRQYRYFTEESLHVAGVRYRDQGPGRAFAVRPAVLRNPRFQQRQDHDFRRRDSAQEGWKVVGAIGVSGGSGDQDHAVAEAGAAAF